MGEETKAKDVDVEEGCDQVPEKVSRCHGLDEADGTVIAPYPFLPVHGLALLVRPHYVEGETVDQCALYERHDMGIPVGFLAARVPRVVLRREPVGENGRHDEVDEGVEEGGAEDLVDV